MLELDQGKKVKLINQNENNYIYNNSVKLKEEDEEG